MKQSKEEIELQELLYKREQLLRLCWNNEKLNDKIRELQKIIRENKSEKK